MRSLLVQYRTRTSISGRSDVRRLRPDPVSVRASVRASADLAMSRIRVMTYMMTQVADMLSQEMPSQAGERERERGDAPEEDRSEDMLFSLWQALSASHGVWHRSGPKWQVGRTKCK